MFGGDAMFDWPADIARFLMLTGTAIVGVLAFGSVVWSAVEIWRRR